MAPHDDIGATLRRNLPGATPPPSLHARIEASLGDTPPGRQRAIPPARAPWAIAAALLLAATATLPWALSRPTAAPTPRVAALDPDTNPPAPDPTLPDPTSPAQIAANPQWSLVQVSNPLTSEATRLWADVQRLRAGLEGPARLLNEAARSL